MSFQWDERTRTNLQASRSRFALRTGDNVTTSDNVRLGGSRALSEIDSVSMSAGLYRTRREAVLRALVCPADEVLCILGLLAREPVRIDRVDVSSGSQYDVAYDLNTSERGSLRLAISRQLTPSALGVVRADSLSAALGLSLSPHLQASTLISQSRSSTPATATAPRPTLRTLDMSLSWAVREDLNLSAGATLRLFQEPTTDVRTRSRLFSITLQYQGSTMRGH
jgi:hypothetical protein